MSNLTEEQEGSVTMFQEVTAVEDRSQAIRYLEMSNWNIEQAINLQMSGALDNTGGGGGGGGGGGRVTQPPGGGGHAEQDRMIEHEEQGPVSRVIEGALRLTGRIVGGIGSLLYGLIIPDEEGAAARENFTGGASSCCCFDGINQRSNMNVFQH